MLILFCNDSSIYAFLKRNNGVPISGVKIPAKIASGTPFEATTANK